LLGQVKHKLSHGQDTLFMMNHILSSNHHLDRSQDL
jgi:hypothetical protein